MCWTRLDTTAALPDKKLLYRYTLLTNGPVKEVFPDKDEFLAKLKQRTTNNYRTSDEMRWYRESKITLVYRYFDEEGRQYAGFDWRRRPDDRSRDRWSRLDRVLAQLLERRELERRDVARGQHDRAARGRRRRPPSTAPRTGTSGRPA